MLSNTFKKISHKILKINVVKNYKDPYVSPFQEGVIFLKFQNFSVKLAKIIFRG